MSKKVSLIIPYINDTQFYLGLRLSDGNAYRYSLPGGSFKENETPAQAAVRELREETQLTVIPDTLTKLMQWSNPQDDTVIYLFSAKVQGVPDGSKDPDQEFKKFKVVDFSGGVPVELIPHLHGPKDTKNNLLVQHFGIKGELNKTDRLKGGAADKRSSKDFDPIKLAQGTEHELEHTKDSGLAQEIAMDHLTEDLDYYVKLRSMEKALKDVPKGKEIPGTHSSIGDMSISSHDYNHALSPEHVNAGYSLHVRHNTEAGAGGSMFANIMHGGKKAGTVMGTFDKKGVLEPHSDIEAAHQGKGLGKAAYTALFAHALHNGIFKVQGGHHTDQAHYVHKSLAKQHGLNYRTIPHQGIEGVPALTSHPGYETELK